MKTQKILSTGIDIGTSTTQLIISSLSLEVLEGFGRVPEARISKREVIYKSDIYFTPLSDDENIDAAGVLKIISNEYKKAEISPDELETGAVIITGESSRKKNAREVADAVCSVSGKFTAAVCGPDLEGILAGKGSGACGLSKRECCRVMNIDVGGGTTNICVYDKGEVSGTACLEAGGRLVKVAAGKVSYVSEKIKCLTDLRPGDTADICRLKNLADHLAGLILQAAGLEKETPELEMIKTNRLLSSGSNADIYMFSGGVGALMYQNEKEIFRYGDAGVLLAEALNKALSLKNADIRRAKEARRSTVIGAGNYSLALSGSTVEYSSGVLPLKNIPVCKVKFDNADDLEHLYENIKSALELLEGEFPAALYMEGLLCPSFIQIQKIAGELSRAASAFYPEDVPVIVIFKNDMAKAAGQALKRSLKDGRPFICLDGIKCESTDHIDLAVPAAFTKAVPVTVKTLVFG